ncbi:MAG: SRPBCC family protein [Zetaproteobacteria bacterium]|nr:SRPBCC family protein [Zetaproteobacteria bacterium]
MFQLPFTCQQEIVVDLPIDQVFSQVGDFHTWAHWSPWVCAEPECAITIQNQPLTIGHRQEWDGKIIGSGTMSLSAIEPHKQLTYALHFLKPWKSHSTTRFTFTDLGEQTQLTWSMEGNLPLFLFFMKKMMVALIQSDYKRGLTMLKEWLETGEVASKITHQGKAERPGFFYLGYQRSCHVEDMSTKMKEDFQKLMEQQQKGHLPEAPIWTSIYLKMDPICQDCEYIAALGYPEEPNSVSRDSALVTGEISNHHALRTDHQGAYPHLGNAWFAALAAQRAYKEKINKRIPMYEIYVNSPDEVDAKELSTEIYIPVKG